MKFIKRIPIPILIFTSLIVSCDSESEADLRISQETTTINGVSNANGSIDFSNELFYKGGIINLIEEGADKKYSIQEITKQKQDLKYRAKRIPTELYLRNKGLEADELTDAIAEVTNEQLFYFEFEQEQKQDLVKKYLEDDLDANVSYLSFDIYRDFKLIKENGDTVQSAYSLYERNFHVAPYERIIISFNGVDQNEAVQLIYKDQLFGKGSFYFAFASTNYIENNIKNPS